MVRLATPQPADIDGAYHPAYDCDRCGRIIHTGARYASFGKALEAADRRAAAHEANHRREDEAKADPFAHL